MAKQKEKTLEELLRKTKKLAESRPSCVLEGKASMRGPGVNDPIDVAGSAQVCDLCGSSVHEGDGCFCSSCERGFHTSCLELPLNDSSVVDWLCSQCQRNSHVANETLRNFSCNSSKENVMACPQDPQSGNRDGLLLGTGQSGSQDASCLVSKSVGGGDDDVKPADQSEERKKDLDEDASCATSKDIGKSFHGRGESSKQSLALDSVRRSKRGRPYKPVGGLHPNKRKNVDNFSIRSEKMLQGRSKPSTDEEDELRAKVKEFRIISTIDGKDVSETLSCKDTGPTIERDFRLAEEGEVDAVTSVEIDDEITMKARHDSANSLTDSGLGSRNGEGSHLGAISCEERLRNPTARADSALEKESSELEEEKKLMLEEPTRQVEFMGSLSSPVTQAGSHGIQGGSTGIFEASVPNLVPKCENNEVAGKELSLPDESVDDQQISPDGLLGIRYPDKQCQRNEQLSNPGKSPSPSLKDVGSSKNNTHCEKGMLAVNSGLSMAGTVLQSSTSAGAGSPPRALILQETAETADLGNESSPCEGNIAEKSDGSVEGRSGNLVSSTFLDQGKKEPIVSPEDRVRDSVSKSLLNIGKDNVFQDDLCADSGHSTLGNSQGSHHSGKKGNAGSKTDRCLLDDCAMESHFECFIERQPPSELPLAKEVSTDESSQPVFSAKGGTSQCPIEGKHPTGNLDSALKSTSKLGAMNTVLKSMSNTQEASVFVSTVTQTGPILVPCPFQPSSSITPPCPTGATNRDLEYHPSQSSPTSVLLEKNPAELSAAVKVGSDVPVAVAGVQASVVPAGKDTAKNTILQSATPAQSELKGSGPDDASVLSLGVVPVTAVVAETGASRDDCIDMVSEELPVPLGFSSEEVMEKGLQNSSLEEEDDVKVCDICGDAGYEECLAVCSACSEGAEHIYCMQALLQSVPEDGWLCEGCKLMETVDNVKEVEDHSPSVFLPGSGHLSPKRRQIMKSNTRSRLSALLDKGKGSSQRKGATKGPPNHQLSTKRPADDILTVPSGKKQALESPGVLPPVATSTSTARSMTRENSFKTPDSGKVKFLSPNALASMPVGGGIRNASKSSGFTGVLSHSPRSSLGQAASKSRYTPMSGLSSDSVGVVTTATKQPLTPRLPSYHVSAPLPTAGRAVRPNEPLPSFLLPSRSGTMKGFAVSKGTSDGNGVQPLCRETSSASQFGRSSGKGGTGVTSGKMNTPRPSSQLPGAGMLYSLKGDSAIGSYSFDSSGIPGKGAGSQKNTQVSEPVKSLSRLPSSSRLSLTQSPRDEVKLSQDLQVARGSQKDPKFNVSLGSVTTNSTSILNSPTVSSYISSLHSQDVDVLEGPIHNSKAFRDFSKGKLFHPPVAVGGDSQRNVGGVSHNEISVPGDIKKLLKVSMTSSSSSKQTVVNDMLQNSLQELQSQGVDLKWKEVPETSWPSSKVASSVSTTRCYKCKEIGHSVQNCSSRSNVSTSLADPVTSNIGIPALMISPKESLRTSSACLWTGVGPKSSDNSPRGESKHAVSSPEGLLPLQVVDHVRHVPCSETPTDVSHRPVKMVTSGSLEEVSKKDVDELKSQLATSMPPSEFGIMDVENGQPEVVTSRGLQSMLLETEKLKSNLETDTLRRQVPMPTSLNDVRNLARILSQNGKQQEGLPIGNLSPLESLTEGRRLEKRTGTVHEISPKLTSQVSQASCGEGSMVSRSSVLPVPANFSIRPLEPPLPTPMMMMQLKGSSPWTPLVPPRPMFGGATQDARGIRVASDTCHGVGTPTANIFGSPPAVPETQCLWRGGFEVVSAAVPAFYDGLQGYSSSFAAPKVRAVTKTLPSRLQLEEVRRLFNGDAWPKQFQLKPPTDKEIALYFFADNESFERGYSRLLDHMMVHDLVLIGQVEGAEILIFPSCLLPVEYHRWKNKMFLWGVYRAKKPNPVSTAAPPAAGQSDVIALTQSSPKILGDSLVQPSTKLVGLGQAEKLAGPGMSVVSSHGDSGEIDMEIDVASDKDVPQRPLRKSGWDKSAINIGPPLPQDPAPVQPLPPNIQIPLSLQERETTQDTSSLEIKCEASYSAPLDLPPGFGPTSQKQLPAQIEAPRFESTSSQPPGFERLKDGVVPVTVKTDAAGEGLTVSKADVHNPVYASCQLQFAPQRENNGAEHVRSSANPGQASLLSAPSPSPRDLRDDSGFSTSRASAHGVSLSSSRSPHLQRDKLKDPSGGSRAVGYFKERGKDREGEKDTEPQSSKEIGRDRQRGRSLGRVREKERSRDGDREKERSCDGDREKERSRDGDREKDRSRDRDREKERSRDRERETERSRERDWEKERSYNRDREKEWSWERSREKERSRERERGKEKSQERGREKDSYRDRDREKVRSSTRDRHRHYRHKDRDRGRETKYHRHTRSQSQSKSCSHCHSASRQEHQSPSVSPRRRRSSGKCRSTHRSRSFSNSPDSNGERPWRRPVSTDRCAESSREQSQEGTVRRVTHSDNERDGKIGQEDRNDEASRVSKLLVYSGIEHTVTSPEVAHMEDSKRNKVQPNVASIPFYDINQQDGETESSNSFNVKSTGDTVPQYHVFLAAGSGGVQLEADIAPDEPEQPFLLDILPTSRGSASNLDLLSNQTSLEILENSESWEIDKPEECSGYQFFPVKGGNVDDVKESVLNPSLELALGGKDRKNVQKLKALPFFGPHVNVRDSSLEVLDRSNDSVGSPGLKVGFAYATKTGPDHGISEICSPLNLTLSVPQYRKEGNKWVKIEQAEALLGEEDLDSLKLGL